MTLRIGIIGAGRIGGNAARLLAAAGHRVMLSFARDHDRLAGLAAELGEGAEVGTVADAASFGEVVILSVPWDLIDDALVEAGSLEGRIVIDTTNQFGRRSLPGPGETAAQHNVRRMPGARYAKAFNTLTAGFQAEAARRAEPDRAVLFLCGDDADAKRVVSGLIADAGFVAIDVGGTAAAAVMEPPRRREAVYGEEYRRADGEAVAAALRAGAPIPPRPR